MSHPKIFPLTLLIIFTLLTSCKDEKIEKTDPLEQIGILGKWNLQSLTINGITDLIIHYDTIQFNTGDNIDDYKGEFRSVGPGYETIGEFQLNETNNTVLIEYSNTQRQYEFQISNTSMTFTNFEDNDDFIEDWSKVE